MTQPWVICMRRCQASDAVILRQVAGVEVAEADEFLWIRGEDLNDQSERRLHCLPVVERYDLQPDGQLVVHGQRVPTGRLPEVTWTSVRDWFELELPPVSWPRKLNGGVPLRLVPCGEVNDVSLLLTSIGEWLEFGTRAPSIRLEGLRFAACDDARVLIQGHPLPSLRGIRFVCDHGIAVPAGWRYEPAVDAGIVADVLQIADGDLAVLEPLTSERQTHSRSPDSREAKSSSERSEPALNPRLRKASSFTVEIVFQEQFVRATRSSIRVTAEALTSG